MALDPLVKPLGIVSVCLAIIQGLTWTILSLITILIHFEVWKINNQTSDTHGERLNAAILIGYILGDEGFSPTADVFIKPKHFYIWAILIMVISLFWVGLSSYVLKVLITNKNHNFKKCILAWCIWTVVVCIIDLLLTSLLAKDYFTLVDVYNSSMNMTNVYALLACGIVLTISAKGFIAWFINVGLIVAMLKVYLKLPNNFQPLDCEYSTNSLAFLRNPSDRSRNVRYNGGKNSFAAFQGLPRVAAVHSVNPEVTSDVRDSEYPNYTQNYKHENPEYFVKQTPHSYQN